MRVWTRLSVSSLLIIRCVRYASCALCCVECLVLCAVFCACCVFCAVCYVLCVVFCVCSACCVFANVLAFVCAYRVCVKCDADATICFVAVDYHMH